MFFYYLHSTTPIVTKPSKLAATRRLYLQLSVALVRHQSKKTKVHLVTVGMQELSRASLQARRSQGPGSESLQRARLPDQSVCTWEGQPSINRFSLWEWKQKEHIDSSTLDQPSSSITFSNNQKYWWSCNVDEVTRSSMNLATNFNISSSVRAPSYLFVPSLT